MHTTITVGQVLNRKGHDLWSIAPGATAYHALESMADKNVGALLVMENEKLVGMFSERDYARKVVLRGKTSRETAVAELMTQLVFYVTPEQTVEECLALMTDRHVRHLPVLAGTRIVGIVTIGDVGKAIISEQRTTIRHLETYICGSGAFAS